MSHKGFLKNIMVIGLAMVLFAYGMTSNIKKDIYEFLKSYYVL